MKLVPVVFLIAVVVPIASAVLVEVPKERIAFKTTAQRIASHNYPVETHTLQTKDSYILTLFRIPYSPKLKNHNKHRPVVFLEHGFLSSSDCWILNGPDDALAYVLSDAGYDVWMGNNRGNTYSKKNLNLSPNQTSFWDFSWHEIAIKDLPAMIDYTLKQTKEHALHYVGHSQGTTVFFVLTSVDPSYNAKIKTAHMLAPIAYMNHMKSPLAKVAGPLLGNPSFVSDFIGSNEFMPSSAFLSALGSKACADSSKLQPLCVNVLFLIAGWDSKHLNTTLLGDMLATHPAGASSSQLIHYMQEYLSGLFRKFDFGLLQNLIKYGLLWPPNYVEKNIKAPVSLYYSANDNLAAVEDVQRIMRALPNLVYSFLVPYPDFNHLDFLFALEVKKLLYDKIVKALDTYEKHREQGKP